MKHYRLLEDFQREVILEDNTITLYRIQATKDSTHVKEGEIGGWIESEDNIVGNSAWVGKDAIVCGSSIIQGKALVTDSAIVIHSKCRNQAHITGNALLHKATVLNRSSVCDNAYVGEGSMLWERVSIGGNAKIRHASIRGEGKIQGDFSVDSTVPFSVGKDTILEDESILLSVDSYMVKDSCYGVNSSFVQVDGGDETLYEIHALKAMEINKVTIRKGTVGGAIESRKNLEENAWIGENVSVSGDGIVKSGEIILSNIPIHLQNREEIEEAAKQTLKNIRKDVRQKTNMPNMRKM